MNRYIVLVVLICIAICLPIQIDNTLLSARSLESVQNLSEISRIETAALTKGESIPPPRDIREVDTIEIPPFQTGGIKPSRQVLTQLEVLSEVFTTSLCRQKGMVKIKKCMDDQLPTLTTTMSIDNPPAQTVPAGTTNVKLAEFDFTANKPLTLYGISITIPQTPVVSSTVTNLLLRADNVQVGTIVIDPLIGSSFENKFIPLMLSFTTGETKKFAIYGDIRATAFVGAQINVQIDTYYDFPGQYTWAGISFGAPIGNTFTIGPAIVPPSTTPSTLLFLGGGNDVVSYASFNDVFKSTNLQQWNTLAAPTTSSTMWSGRRSFEALYFNAKYWVFGGGTPNTPRLTDIWNSSDGVVWNKVSSSLPFANYYRYKSIVFDNKIYVIGGRSDYAGGTVQAKAWSTVDGIHWTTTVLPFFERENPTLGVFNDELYVIGGVQGVLSSGCTLPVGYSTTTGLPCSYAQSDIWKTTNGITWSKVGNTSLLGSTSDAKILTYNNKLYFMGGVAWGGVSGGSSRKIYTSTDGNSWAYLNTNFPSSTSLFQEIDAVVVNGKMVVGDSRNVLPFGNKLWTSTDGFVWVQQSSSLPWSPRTGYRMIAN